MQASSLCCSDCLDVSPRAWVGALLDTQINAGPAGCRLKIELQGVVF